ncbi:hypothetical protein HUT03_02250 [Candidatus Liberibacter africanus]|nr:hypothetical protein HUT03_02250 [Candidatus Liberibacter africanus]
MMDLNTTLSKQINTLIDETIPEREPRKYLGASLIGDSCPRKLQYHMTGTPPDQKLSGIISRIFDTGHALEKVAIEWMRQAGFELLTEDETGQQFGFSQGDGAIQGHIDGIITSAPEELNLAAPCLWECKTMNNKSWLTTSQQGLVKSKPVYASQIAFYQAYMECYEHPALFMAINKDTSELYFERVPFDGFLAQQLTERAVNIIEDTKVDYSLPRISEDPECFFCRFCEFKRKCWNEQA